MVEPKIELTRMLREGDVGDSLLPLVYDELRAMAQKRMSAERAGHTLQATALVHEAYVRLMGDEEFNWRDRKHFYSAAAESMRRILIDHARRVKSLKRGGDKHRVTLGAQEAETNFDPDQFLALNEALDRLAEEDERAALVTRMRYFAGLTVEDTAKALDISERSVHREWTYARARLFELIGDE